MNVIRAYLTGILLLLLALPPALWSPAHRKFPDNSRAEFVGMFRQSHPAAIFKQAAAKLGEATRTQRNRKGGDRGESA